MPSDQQPLNFVPGVRFSEVPEFYGALRRIQQWNFGALYITCNDVEVVKEWPDFLPLHITAASSEVRRYLRV